MEDMQWQSGGRKIKEEEKEGKEGPLYPFTGPIREGEGFLVTPCRKGRLAFRVQVRDEPISTRLHVTERWVKKTVEKGGIYRKKWLARRGGTGAF